MSDDDPRLVELDIECITITCDQEGCVTFDAGGMTLERASWLLRSAEYLMMTDHWFGEEDDDETAED